jgi:hypothetical protein
MNEEIDDTVIQLVDLVDEGPYAKYGGPKKGPIQEEKKKILSGIDVSDIIEIEARKHFSSILEEVMRDVERDLVSAAKVIFADVVEKVLGDEISKMKKIKF